MIRLLVALLLAGGAFGGQVSYRVRLTANDGNRVVTLTSEEYVSAVLAGEASTFRNDEALKALAVAARTYAARTGGRHAAEGFDFCATTHCQRAEIAAIPARCRDAANATAGEMLWLEGKPILAVYTRNCGGQTEAGAVLWPDTQTPYLPAHSDPYCSQRGQDRWSWKARPAQIAAALGMSGLHAPSALSFVAIVSRTSSGRAKTLLLRGPDTILISASSLRFAVGRALGWNTIRSDLYQVQSGGGLIRFRGAGAGHGAGLCQAGAEEMAAEGRTYREILAFYYPGTAVGTLPRKFNWTRLSGENITVFADSSDSSSRILSVGETMLRELEAKLGWTAPRGITIRAYPDVASFRNATGEPGWVAARTSGREIAMQPAEVLQSRGILQSTVRHELFHVMVETRAAPGLPVWFREGVVEWLSDPGKSALDPAESNDADLRQRSSRSRAEHGYAAAEARVRALAERYGADAVLTWVTPGLPDAVKNSSESSAATKIR